MPVAPAHTWGAYGAIQTDRSTYAPLDTVVVNVTGRRVGDSQCTVKVCGPDRVEYASLTVDLHNNKGQTAFTTGAGLGPHYLFLHFDDRPQHYRYLNFIVDAKTSITTGHEQIDKLPGFMQERMNLGRREYALKSGKFVGFISGDTWHFDGIWLRDSIHAGAGYQYWETKMQETVDAFLAAQDARGMVADGIERDGRTWRVGMESDVEYILIIGAYRAWSCTGDDAWLARILPKLEKALEYITTDPKHWDEKHGLIKRQHSCDTWDYDIDGQKDSGTSRHVVANCDQSGYALAFELMSRMYDHLGDSAAATQWEQKADGYKRRAVDLLWDGSKFQHHFHLDSITHDGFDESQQLAMGNTWAATRGLANPDQARAIIDEYHARNKRLPDAFPWWSLQPGYPDELGYFKSKPFTLQGGYANGGLMPWVGAELCRAAFMHGREDYGVQLLNQYLDHLEKTGGSHVWYWTDGEAGHRTTNEVNYTGWGMGEWLHALIAGLAGVDDVNGRMRAPIVSVRWLAAGIHSASVVARYGASNSYSAYNFTHVPGSRVAAVQITGSDNQARLRLLLPEKPNNYTATINGEHTPVSIEKVDGSTYLCVDVEFSGSATLTLGW